ncbi:MAG: septum formation protein Maf [Muribaculaceae bacterium]|nr:septum formation protein Maf [Muribaculaceae bacterium]
MKFLEKYDVVLASNSPRRRELLADMDINFRVEVIGDIEESYPDDLPAEKIAEYLSRLKANAYGLSTNELLITADTIVVLGDKVLGKPENEEQAREMLEMLSGMTHQVITGVTVRTHDHTETFSDITEVEFAHLTPDEIDYYVSNYHPTDKAGAYGIQEWIGCVGIRRINGSFYNVMGLPVQKLYETLKTCF